MIGHHLRSLLPVILAWGWVMAVVALYLSQFKTIFAALWALVGLP